MVYLPSRGVVRHLEFPEGVVGEDLLVVVVHLVGPEMAGAAEVGPVLLTLGLDQQELYNLVLGSFGGIIMWIC